MTDIDTLKTLIMVLQEKLANAVLQNAELEALLKLERAKADMTKDSQPNV
jgi:hypothetical protein